MEQAAAVTGEATDLYLNFSFMADYHAPVTQDCQRNQRHVSLGMWLRFRFDHLITTRRTAPGSHLLPRKANLSLSPTPLRSDSVKVESMEYGD